jgi:hypothetical protein
MLYLLIAFSVLNIADGYLTYQGIRFGAKEMNPLMRWAFMLAGPYYALLILKVCIVVVVWYFVMTVQPIFESLRRPDILCWFMGIVDIGYALLIVWNWIQLKKQKG